MDLACLTTPKKRRTVEVLIETPSKRFHADDLDSLIQKTPKTDSEQPLSPAKRQVYVEISTPSKLLGVPRTPNRRAEAFLPSSSDLRGYGSEEEIEYTHRRDAHMTGIRSSGKRTGDRDDRGCFQILFTSILVLTLVPARSTGETPIPSRGHF